MNSANKYKYTKSPATGYQATSSFTGPPNSIFINKNYFNGASKVLVNPKFKHSQVYINPNFKNHSTNQPSSVYVNPNMISMKSNSQPPASVITTTTASSQVTTNRFCKVNNSVQPKPALKPVPLLKTKTKLIRVHNVANTPKLATNISKSYVKTKLGMNVQSKRIVRRHKLIKVNVGAVAKQKVLQSKYRIDRKNNMLKQFINRRPAQINSKFVKVNRNISKPVLKSRYKITRKSSLILPQNTIIKNSKFKLIRNVSKTTATKTSQVASVKRLKKTKVNRNIKNLRKNNIPCDIFNRTGICKAFSQKKCFKLHNPNNVQICPRFLQGACHKKCLLSHKILPEKMPTCKFFLDGICHKENCPYLHVKLSKDAPICLMFLQGFCSKGVNCDKRHQFLCPDFEKDGKCTNKLCRYPHGNVVRQYTFKLMRRMARNAKSQPESAKSVESNGKSGENLIDLPPEKRYYECNASKSEEKQSANDANYQSIFDRPKLGTLPSFISF